MADLFSTALSGVQNAGQSFGVRSNNIANLTTPGFRASRALSSTRTGGGSQVASVRPGSSAGALEITGNPLDLSIAGEGFFRVSTSPGDRFTRAGAFTLDANRDLVLTTGERVQPGIRIPAEATGFQVMPGGAVTALYADGAVAVVGQLDLSRFPNPSGLLAQGGNLFAPSSASGLPSTGVPGSGVFGSIFSGSLEGSNVDLATELVGQMTDRITFGANVRAIRARNEMLGTLLDLTG